MMVEESNGILNTIDIWAKKCTENCTLEAYARMQQQLDDLQSQWDALGLAVAEEKSKLETSRLELANYDESLKKEQAWLRNVDRYLLDAADLCTDLAEKKSRLQRTRVCDFVRCRSTESVSFWSPVRIFLHFFAGL